MKKIKQKFSWDGVTDDFTGDTEVIRDEFLANEST